MASKNEVLKSNLKEWLACSKDKTKRGEMIQSMSTLLHIHEKSVGRAFRRIQLDKKIGSESNAGRREFYGADVNDALFDVLSVLSYSCAENLHSAISEIVNNLEDHGNWKHAEDVTWKLKKMSLGTMKNRVGRLRVKYQANLNLSSTRGSPLKEMIPVYRGSWRGLPVGMGQIDTVAHCGGNLAGDYVFTTNYTDANSYWLGLRAQWCKGEKATMDSLEYVRINAPFKIFHIHPDSGGEFINYHVKAWADSHNIDMSRSEPGKSNDNMYVEERNGHVVRKYLGSSRYDKLELVDILNEYYETLCIYLNYFMPVRRIKDKRYENHNVIRVHEKTGLTPYHRLLANEQVSLETKEILIAKYKTLDLLAIKKKLDTMRLLIHKVQNA